MIKKIIGLLLVTYASTVFCSEDAKGMSGERFAFATPFFSAEGSYNTTESINLRINNITAVPDYSSWGGRIAGGFMQPYKNNISFTEELGWGYYIKATHSIPSFGYKAVSTLTGFDALLGVMRTYKQIDFYVKGGAMFQRTAVLTQSDLSKVGGGNSYSGITNITTSSVDVIPEIKVGGQYHVYKNMALSLSYAHTFGTDVTLDTTSVTNGGQISTSQYKNTQSPPLNLVMFGIQYYFV